MNLWASSFLLFAQTSTTTRPAVEEPSLLSPVMVFAIVLLILAVPFGLGSLIARSLKMKDLAMKISVIILATELGLAPFLAEYVRGYLEKRQYNQQLAHWQEKENARKKITESGIEELKSELKKANPQFQIQYQLPDKETEKTASGD